MKHTSTAHVFTFATLGLIAGTACQSDADVSGGERDVGRTVDTGRPDAGAPDVAPYDALRPDALLDALPDPGIDASSPPLPPGCEATLDSLETTGAYCWWQDGDPGPDAFNEPFVGRAIVESVVENGLDPSGLSGYASVHRRIPSAVR